MEALDEAVYPLHVAVLRRDTDAIIQVLHKESSIINSRYSDHNYTPLMLSVMDRRPEFRDLLPQNPQDRYPVKLVECLLSHGACVNDYDDKGCTPLHMAVKAAGSDVVKVLLEAGAEVNAQDGKRLTPLHHLSLSLQAQNDGPMQAKIAKLLLENGGNAFAPDHFSVTPIEKALCHYWVNLDQIQAYLDCGVDINDPRLNSDNGATLLHRFAMSRVFAFSKSVLALLIESGFSGNATNFRGETPLHMAAQHHRESLSVMTLCDLGADAAIVDHLKRSPLHYFQMTKKHPYMVIPNFKCLLKNGADINAQDMFGCTPLHYALIFQEEPALIKHLLQEGASVGIRDIHQKTALHYAAEYQRLQALEYLLERSSKEDLNSTDKYGSSALHYAVLANSSELVSLLIKAGVDTGLKDTQGKTARDIAKMWGYTDMLKLLVQSKIEETDNCMGATLAIPSSKLLLDSPSIESDNFEGIQRPEDLQQFCDKILESPLFVLWSRRGTPQDEAEAVTKEVTLFIQQLSNICKEINSVLQFTPKLRGSVAENTKYGPPDEFDFMLVLDGFKDICEIESQGDFSRIIYNGKDDNWILENLPYAIKQGKILDWGIVGLRVFGIIKDALSCEETWHNSELQLSDISLQNVSIKMSVRWTGVYFKALHIDLDLVPCIPICNYDSSNLTSLWPVELDYSGCSAYCLLSHCSFDNDYYRETFKYELSTTEFEQVILGSLSDDARKGYVLAKALRSPFISHTVEHYSVVQVKQFLSKSFKEKNEMHQSAEECVSSYLLKTALLKEVKKQILSGEMDNESTPQSYLLWTRRIYSNLLASLQCNKVDSFFKRVNLMFGSRGFSVKTTLSHQFDEWKSGLMNDSLNDSEDVKGLQEALEKDYKQLDLNVEDEESMVTVVHDTRVFVKVINYILN